MPSTPTQQPAKTIEIGPQTRAATIVPASYKKSDNTVDVVWTTGIMRRAYDWMTDTLYDEELVVDAASVDMARFDAGVVQVIDNHRVHGGLGSIIGIASRGWIEAGEGRATLALRTSTPELAAIAADIEAGLLRAMSFGYSVQKYEITPAHMRSDGGTVPLYRAVRWTPQEISFVAVPADPNAGTRSQQPAGATAVANPCELVRADAQPQPEPLNMPQTINQSAADAVRSLEALGAPATPAASAAVPATGAPAAPVVDAAALAARAADITELCTRHGVPALAADLIRKQATVEAAGLAVLEEKARHDASAGGARNVGDVRTVRDETQTRMDGIQEALMHRVDTRSAITDNGRQYRGMSLLEIGRDYLEARGISTRGMEKMRIAQEMLHFRSPGMHTTSDFANIMANVANKRLRGSYDENPGTYAMWARRAPNAPDFKNISVVQLSGAPDLLRTNEHAEFKYGTMTDAGATYAVVTSGRIVTFTRQAIVNDDMRAFDRLVGAFGNSARRLENRTVYSILTANAALGDGVALFSAASGARKQANVQTGAGSALQFSSLSAGRTAMRLMKGLSDEELNIAPSYLLVPAALEQAAYQLTSANYVAAQQSAVSEFRSGGKTALEPIVEPLLDAASATAWYLAAGTSAVDTVEYCFLDGADGPVIESEPGFEVDGISYKCRHDFGATAVDHRGLHRSAGA